MNGWLSWLRSWRSDQRVGPGVRSVGVCWDLVYRGGLQVDDGDGGPPHFPSQEKAAGRATDYAVPDLGVPVPRRRLAACWVITSVCGTTLDEENTFVMHHDTPDEARQMAAASEWVQVHSGRWQCSKSCGDCAGAL